MCVCVFAQQVQVPAVFKERILSSGAGFTGSCEPFYVGAGNQAQVLSRSEQALNC